MARLAGRRPRAVPNIAFAPVVPTVIPVTDVPITSVIPPVVAPVVPTIVPVPNVAVAAVVLAVVSAVIAPVVAPVLPVLTRGRLILAPLLPLLGPGGRGDAARHCQPTG
jgi:hypothetical protein